MTEEFFERQLSLWPLAAANYKALQTVRSRSFSLNQDLDIRLKCIPQRIRSAAADTSRAGIAARPCFLCAPQLPAEQLSLNLIYDNKQIKTGTAAQESGYRLLVNPYPAFDKHFTIAAVSHREQSLSEELPAMLALAEFMPSYVLFYNAPGAGASAPDHLHFQAVPKGSLPLERDFAAWHVVHSRVLFVSGQTEVYCQEDFLRSAWLLRSRKPEELCLLLQEVLDLITTSMPNRQTGTSTETNNNSQTMPVRQKPAVNLLSWYADGLWTCVLFARSKHRPACYYETGGQQVLISPASVEMGGQIILVRPEDFDKVKPGLLTQIYAEVSLPKQAYSDISETWKALHHRSNHQVI